MNIDPFGCPLSAVPRPFRLSRLSEPKKLEFHDAATLEIDNFDQYDRAEFIMFVTWCETCGRLLYVIRVDVISEPAEEGMFMPGHHWAYHKNTTYTASLENFEWPIDHHEKVTFNRGDFSFPNGKSIAWMDRHLIGLFHAADIVNTNNKQEASILDTNRALWQKARDRVEMLAPEILAISWIKQVELKVPKLRT